MPAAAGDRDRDSLRIVVVIRFIHAIRDNDVDSAFDRADLRSVRQPQLGIRSAKRKLARCRIWNDEAEFLVGRNLREVLRESLKTEMRRASGKVSLGIQFDNEFLISREVCIVAAINDKVFVLAAVNLSLRVGYYTKLLAYRHRATVRGYRHRIREDVILSIPRRAERINRPHERKRENTLAHFGFPDVNSVHGVEHCLKVRNACSGIELEFASVSPHDICDDIGMRLLAAHDGEIAAMCEDVVKTVLCKRCHINTSETNCLKF